MTGSPPEITARRVELLAVLSLGADLGLGRPMEHVLRECLIAMRLAERVGRQERARAVDVLADLSTHLEWGGRRQRRNFRLTALHAEGPARVGAEFTSVGSIPMSSAPGEDRSVVVRAESGEVLEFHTDGVVVWPGGTRTDARREHRYQIEPEGEGSRVVYRLRRTAITNPPLRMRVPVMRTMKHRVMIPLLCRRGFVNLVETAERRAAEPAGA